MYCHSYHDESQVSWWVVSYHDESSGVMVSWLVTRIMMSHRCHDESSAIMRSHQVSWWVTGIMMSRQLSWWVTGVVMSHRCHDESFVTRPTLALTHHQQFCSLHIVVVHHVIVTAAADDECRCQRLVRRFQADVAFLATCTPTSLPSMSVLGASRVGAVQSRRSQFSPCPTTVCRVCCESFATWIRSELFLLVYSLFTLRSSDWCRQTVFILLLLLLLVQFLSDIASPPPRTVSLWFSWNLAHMIHVPICTKVFNRFSKFCFYNFFPNF